MLPLYDSIRSERTPWVMRAIILVNVLVYVYMALLNQNWLEFNSNRIEAFILTWAFKPITLVSNPPDAAIDIFTSMFMHGGLLHLAGNMLFLWIFGDNIEDRLGHGRFLVFYLAAGIAAALTQGILGGFATGDTQSPMLGASGAIGGVLGAYLMLYPRSCTCRIGPTCNSPACPEAILAWHSGRTLAGLCSGFWPCA
jgi:membrane associated rhomboid family serine protease